MTDRELQNELVRHAAVLLPDGSDALIATAEGAPDLWTAAFTLSSAVVLFRAPVRLTPASTRTVGETLLADAKGAV